MGITFLGSERWGLNRNSEPGRRGAKGTFGPIYSRRHTTIERGATAAPEGAVVSELDLGKTILSTPSIANGAVYVRSDGKLWKLGKS